VAAVSTPTSSFQTPFSNNITVRQKHSSRQIKRLFKKNPARRRIDLKNRGDDQVELNIPQAQFPPAIADPPAFLPNGWNPPPSEDVVKSLPEYPFRVARTKNKPNNAVGFLPVYSEFRWVVAWIAQPLFGSEVLKFEITFLLSVVRSRKDGSKITTRIKKVSGDQDIFLNELRAALQIPIPRNPRDDIVRIRTGGTIEVKGNRVRDVKEWLAGLGF
jgi:Mitochondrial large subunit ribosomal protein (Img2)